ncbi:MAG TPA: hypothetical protein VNH20_03230 [Candidatus Dormibacteraeota bacterium]|nr:hypothetical protein [Candidatus Dormibacteraeota bacterium]
MFVQQVRIRVHLVLDDCLRHKHPEVGTGSPSIDASIFTSRAPGRAG